MQIQMCVYSYQDSSSACGSGSELQNYYPNQDLSLDSVILTFVDSVTLENFSQTGLGSDGLTPKLWLSLARCMIWGKLNYLDLSFLI